MRRTAAFALLVASIGMGPAVVGATQPPDPDRAVEEAKAKAGGVPEQAEALARLAWLSDSPEPVRARARRELAAFGADSIVAMGQAVPRANPERVGEIAETLLEAFRSVTSGIPAGYLPALEDAVWFGGREARTLAIPELARLRSQASVLPIIDAALEDPELEQVAAQALGQLGDARARFYLARLLDEGKPFLRDQAAVALARVGDEGRSLLRSAMKSERKEIRLSAVRAILPFATVDDLTALHEYAASHAADDPPTGKAVEQAAAILERALEASAAEASATPGPH